VLKNASLAMSGGIIAGLGAAVKVSADFEGAMQKVAAIGDLSKNQFTALREEAKRLGSLQGLNSSASEAADAMKELTAAGLDSNEVLKATHGVLVLAETDQLSTARAAEIATIALNGFGLEASKMGHITDVLAASAAKGALSVNDMGETLKYVAPVAKAVGLSLEEVSALTIALSDAGIKGSAAGTSLRQSMASLLNPTKEAEGILQSYNVTVSDGKGGIRNFIDILADLRRAGLTTADAMTLVGTEAGTGFVSLLGKSDEELRKLVTGLEKADGAGQKMASTMNQGLNAQIKQMQSAFEGLAIAIGDTGLLTGITQIVTMFAGLVSKVAQLPPPVLKVVTIAAMVLAILPPLVIGIGSVITAVQSIGTVIPIISAFAAGLSIVPVLVGAAIGVIANLGYQIYKNWDFIRTLSWGEIGYAIVESFKEGVSLALGGLWDFISGYFDGLTVNFSSMSWHEIGANLIGTLIDGIYAAIPGMNTAMDFVASSMDAFLPHSPAKVGALSRLGEVGGGLIGEISSGISKNIPGLQSTLDSGLRVAVPKAQAIVGGVGQVASATNAPTSSGGGVTFNITIQGNVTQSTLQELKNNLREFHAIMKDGARRYGTV
jgi:TP901 family phage tail tape measure protein